MLTFFYSAAVKFGLASAIDLRAIAGVSEEVLVVFARLVNFRFSSAVFSSESPWTFRNLSLSLPWAQKQFVVFKRSK